MGEPTEEELKTARKKIEDSLNKLDVDALRQRIDDAHVFGLIAKGDYGSTGAFDKTFPNYEKAEKPALVKMLMDYHDRAPKKAQIEAAQGIATAGRRRKSRARKSKKVRRRRRTLKK